MADLERINNATPLLIPAISLSVGILLCPPQYHSFNYIFLYIGISCLVFASLLYLILSSKKLTIYQKFKYRKRHYLWLALGFGGLGMIIEVMSSPNISSSSENIINATVTGHILDIKNKTSGDVLYIDVISIKDKTGAELNPNNLLLKIKTSAVTLDYGDIIIFQSNLKKIKDSPNSFYKGYALQLGRNGILYEGEIYNDEYRKLATTTSINILSRKIRDSLEIYIEKTPLMKSTQNFLITVLLGDKEYIDDETRQEFAESGMSHVLALSGLHIGILASILLGIFFPLNFLGKYKIRLVITVLLLWGYAFISGLTPSSVRACAMCTFTFASIILERKHSGINSICFAYILILLFSPNSIYDVGFQLSFLCVFVIITLMPHLEITSHRKHKYLYYVTSLIFVTFIISACCWIVSAFYFHVIPLSFLFANILSLPIMPIYLLIAIIYVVMYNLSIHLSVFGWILDNAYLGLETVQNNLSFGTVLYVTEIPEEAVLLWLLALIILVIYLNLSHKKFFLMGAISCAIFSILCIILYPKNCHENDFIICNNYNVIRINAIKDGKQKEHFLCRYQCDSIRINKLDIVSVDVDLQSINIPSRCDYLIICGGYNGSMAELITGHDVAKIIIHPSVRRKKEKIWMDELNELHADYHSLRYQKSLRVNSQ